MVFTLSRFACIVSVIVLGGLSHITMQAKQKAEQAKQVAEQAKQEAEKAKKVAEAAKQAKRDMYIGYRDIVLAVVRQNRLVVVTTEEVRRDRIDRKVVLTTVQENGGAICEISEEFRGDREVVLAAVTNYGYALQYASPKLRGDREVVLAAVQQDGWGTLLCVTRVAWRPRGSFGCSSRQWMCTRVCISRVA